MGLVASWELVAAALTDDGVVVTALVEHCDGTTRLTTATTALSMEPDTLDAWVAAVRGRRITPPRT